MHNKLIDNFLNQKNYDIKISGDARWIDQKCTPDVVNIIADCILEYTNHDTSIEFTVKDIWNSEYTRNYVVDIFSKPDPNKNSAKNEYDKYFGMPIKLFSYSGILTFRKIGRSNVYKINNLDVLRYISLRETNTLSFLIKYIKKVLKDSGLWTTFEEFFEKQTPEAYYQVKKDFTDFTIKYTKINKEKECGRIFTKIINPLAFNLKKKGTEGGRISKKFITFEDIRYNRENWRDILSGKDKNITRKNFEIEKIQESPIEKYQIAKAKKAVKSFNIEFNDGKSEVLQKNERNSATQIHHIFPQSRYPEISSYIENLIALTPNQHYLYAHPGNQTIYIDEDFQYICLLAKSKTIYEHLLADPKIEVYHFESFQYVLNIGLDTDDFDFVPNLDFAKLIRLIDWYYSDFNNDNNYKELIHQNKLVLSN